MLLDGLTSDTRKLIQEESVQGSQVPEHNSLPKDSCPQPLDEEKQALAPWPLPLTTVLINQCSQPVYGSEAYERIWRKICTQTRTTGISQTN
jgi:hypothetical protein